ncbi:hypothetical protein TNCV_755281 [Trichonephila clavipes]|nr:hypothetical protein TNCV_755281 [Trichonephila clavipes]
MLVRLYEDQTLSKKCVYEWFARFREGRDSVPDKSVAEDRQSPPVTKSLRNDEAHFWLNGYVNKQNCRIWSEANP